MTSFVQNLKNKQVFCNTSFGLQSSSTILSPFQPCELHKRFCQWRFYPRHSHDCLSADARWWWSVGITRGEAEALWQSARETSWSWSVLRSRTGSVSAPRVAPRASSRLRLLDTASCEIAYSTSLMEWLFILPKLFSWIQICWHVKNKSRGADWKGIRVGAQRQWHFLPPHF